MTRRGWNRPALRVVLPVILVAALGLAGPTPLSRPAFAQASK
jgi:hypothetical protein